MPYTGLFFYAFRRYINSKIGLQNAPKKCLHKLKNPRNLGFFGLGFATSHIYFSNLETVPYTMRRQFMLLSSSRERRLGEAWFEAIKSEYKDKIVPPENPNNIRLQKIGQKIVEAARKGILKQAATARPAMMLPHYQHKNMMMRMIKGFSGRREFSHQSANLEGFKWEFVLVDEPHIVNAFCAPAGKIFVFTGLLNMFRDDAAIASVIGHEVGHGVVRHTAETISTDPWLMAAVLIEEMIKETWLNFLMHFIRVWFLEPDDIVVDKVLDLFLRLPHSRRTELEADYIGLMVMASAGYDPRKAPLVWKKFEEMSETSLLGDFISTHPSCEKRCRLLSQPQVMEEALAIYRDTLPTSWSAMARFWLDNLIKR